ncbi:MAG: Na/Pi cotransporter family protein [Planctomycetaceae bacterium]|nr:Na/Pi cotransporter family protein [Planctomycetaceae bacterium]
MSETWQNPKTGHFRSFPRKILLLLLALTAVGTALLWQGTTVAKLQQPRDSGTQDHAAISSGGDGVTAPPDGDGVMAPADHPHAAPDDEEPHHQEYFHALHKHTVFWGTVENRIDLTGPLSRVKSLKNAPVELEILLNTKPDVVEAAIHPDKTMTLTYGKAGKSEITIQATNTLTGHKVFSTMTVEVWTPDYWKMVFTVVGGLGIFLLGMKYMSDGLQAVAGASLRKLIATFTENRFLAVLVGLLTTSIIQSSSVTTVMVVGFINSQIMTLTQGIGVIMGANIGTTVTGWIIAIKVAEYGLPMMGLSGLIFMFSRSDSIKYTAMAVMGLGAVFFGLELMTQGFSILKDLPEFSHWMERFSAATYVGVLKCVAIGCILTLVVQSSSATLGITMSLASIGVIRFETAAALVLGENIGTTITAVLASIGMSINARRAAAFHVLFNVLGVCWVTAIFLKFFLPMILWMIGTDAAGEIKNVTAGIALTHSMFNITNTLLFLPFSRIAANLLTKYIPDKGEVPQKASLTNLHTLLLESSTISLTRSRIELVRMSTICLELADNVKQVMQSGSSEVPQVEKAFQQEEDLDNLQDEIIAFMANMLAGSISHEVAENARAQLRMADELESISDYFLVILKSHLKLNESGVTFPEQEQTEMLELHDLVRSYHQMIHRAFVQRRIGVGLLTDVHSHGNTITRRVKTMRDRFLKRMSEERLDPQVVMAFNAQWNAYRRVREHSQNVAEAMIDVK